MTTFTDLGLPAELVETLERMQITVPTPIQTATIPTAISGRDVLASAQTGSGKTIAYSVPMLMYLINNPGACALILTPTRELAVQVQQTLNLLVGSRSSFKSVLLIGGMSLFKQVAELRRRPRIMVGTPGRINDHLERGSLRLNDTHFLIIDEADRMLDMGFGIQLERIAEHLPQERQTLMFSATLPSNIEKLSKKYLRNPERVSISVAEQAAPKIKQETIQTAVSEKFSHLQKQLQQREGSIIVFVKTKRNADRLSRELRYHEHSVDVIHGDLPQRRRDQVIMGFRNSRIRILVATDIAARGLDIPHVMHVINYDLPQAPEDYVHRIGRTGRAGAEGNALCLVTPEDISKWRAICRLMDPHAVLPQSPLGKPKSAHKSPHGSFRFKKRSFKPRYPSRRSV